MDRKNIFFLFLVKPSLIFQFYLDDKMSRMYYPKTCESK